MGWSSWVTIIISTISLVVSIFASAASLKDRKQENRIANLELDAMLRPYEVIDKKITGILNGIDDVKKDNKRGSYFSLFLNLTYILSEIRDSGLDEVKRHNSDLSLIEERMKKTKSSDYEQVTNFLYAIKEPLNDLRFAVRIKIDNLEKRRKK